MEKYRNKNNNSLKRNAQIATSINTPRERHWADMLDHSQASTYAFILAERYKKDGLRTYEKAVVYKKPIAIRDLICLTSFDYRLSNMPKINDWEHKRLNFGFDDDAKKTMITTPKVIVRAYAHKYTDKKTGRDYVIVRFYALAPELNKSDLPIIYRFDLLTSPNNPSFYGIKCLAVVGGCLDGDCPLFQLKTNGKDTARLFTYKSGYTIINVDKLEDVSNNIHDVTEVSHITGPADACDYAFAKFGCKARINKAITTDNVHELLEILKLPENTVPIEGGDFVTEFLEHGVVANDGCERQYVHTLDGIKTSNLRGSRASNAHNSKKLENSLALKP